MKMYTVVWTLKTYYKEKEASHKRLPINLHELSRTGKYIEKKQTTTTKTKKRLVIARAGDTAVKK